MKEEFTFDCSGKPSSTYQHLPRGSLLTRGDLDDTFKVASSVPHDTDLFSYVRPFSTGILHLKHLLKLTEMNLKIFSRFGNAENLPENSQLLDFHKLRKEILFFVSYVGHYFISIEWHQLQHGPMTELKTGFDEVLFTLRQFLPRLYKIPSSTFHYATSSVSNKSPEFHLFHLHLELRWVTLTLILKKTTPWQEKEDQNDKLNRTIELIIQDLVFISLKISERVDYADLKHKNPFSCSCVKDLWLCIQIIIDKTSNETGNKNFWYYLNNILNNFMKNDAGRGSEVSWHGSRKLKCNLDSKNSELFSLWMIYHLNLLYGYSQDGFYEGTSSSRLTSNFEELEEIFKNYLAKGGKEGERDQIDEELRIMIPLIKTLILDYWKSKQNSLKVVNFLWECFHRRLDQPFLIQTTGPWSISLEKKTPKDILKQIKDRIFEITDSNCKESSYGMFLHLLVIVLHENYSQNDSKILNQVKGRIYSKFPKGKFQEFSEIKLFNLISVFFYPGSNG